MPKIIRHLTNFNTRKPSTKKLSAPNSNNNAQTLRPTITAPTQAPYSGIAQTPRPANPTPPRRDPTLHFDEDFQSFLFNTSPEPARRYERFTDQPEYPNSTTEQARPPSPMYHNLPLVKTNRLGLDDEELFYRKVSPDPNRRDCFTDAPEGGERVGMEKEKRKGEEVEGKGKEKVVKN